MRSGRPAYHIKAKFLSVYNVFDKTITYYELDNKGNLKKDENGKYPPINATVNEPNKNSNIKPIESPNLQSMQPIAPNSKKPENVEETAFFDDKSDLDNNLDFDFAFTDDSILLNDPLDFIQDDNFSEDMFVNIF